MEYVGIAAFLLGTMPYAPAVIAGSLLMLTATMNLKKRSYNDEDNAQK